MLNSVVPDLEFDIEELLRDDEHSHAIPFCYEHRTSEFFPVSGTIVQVLCGRIIRVRETATTQEKCEECKNWHGETNCYVCGRRVYG